MSDMETMRGGRFYDDPRVVADYLAHRHSGPSSPNEVMERPAFRRALGDVTDRHIVDLGCGDGTFATELLDAGCRSYLGVDGSSSMVHIATARHSARNVRFVLGDVEDFTFPDVVDIVTARMLLHYVADVDDVVRRVAQCLAPDGRFVFSVVHPVVTSNEGAGDRPRTSWIVDRYFESGPRQRSWFGSTVTWHHRTIEQYIGALQRAGLSLETLSECEPSAELLREMPDELERRRRVPLMLVVSARRAGASLPASGASPA